MHLNFIESPPTSAIPPTAESFIQQIFSEGRSYSEAVDIFRRRLVEQVLSECGGNRHEAARRLSMDRPNLIQLIKRLGIEEIERAALLPSFVATCDKSTARCSGIALPSISLQSTPPLPQLQQFYGLRLMFIFSSMAGLMTIGIIKLFGIDALQKSGLTTVQASAIAGTAMAIFYSIANGLGRIIWGTISDKTGRQAAIALMCVLQGIVMLVFYWMGGNEYLLYLGAAIIGFNFGGNFSLFPTATADFFGTKNVGRNYGWIFTAYGIGGIIGPIMAGRIRDVWQI